MWRADAYASAVHISATVDGSNFGGNGCGILAAFRPIPACAWIGRKAVNGWKAVFEEDADWQNPVMNFVG